MNFPTNLPITPLRDGPVFPNTETILVFGRNKAVAALEAAFRSDRYIFVVPQKNRDGDISTDNLQSVGTVCQVRHILQADNEINVLVSGVARGRLENILATEPYLIGEISELPETFENDEETQALVHHITTEFQNSIKLGKNFDFTVLMKINDGMAPGPLTDQIAATLDINALEKQQLLEETNVKARLKLVSDYMSKELKVLELEWKISSQAQAKFDKTAKQNILRERKKAIESELENMGETQEDNEMAALKKKANKAGMPEEVLKKTLKELKRLEDMSPMNPEHGYIRSYVDWLLELPWTTVSANGNDIKEAVRILDEDHYGLEKVKERIIEYLAVLKLKQANKKAEDEAIKAEEKSATLPKGGGNVLREGKKKVSSPTILCFVGPPGVGKTSIGKSIAKALGRKFVRISLGGIRDEAEIRGHRRTYVGALPGRIIQGIKQAGTKNPVFMLDEIDKVGNDFRGDPSAALLEALDPEQNHAFSDHYLEVAYDLSEVIFIATANVLETIPHALKDRLEIIEFPGYTAEEKFHIAKQYLISKQLEVNGLAPDKVVISDAALRTIISRYTYEAGVRNLEREIATVFRKLAKKFAEGKIDKKTAIESSDISKYLGSYKFTSTIAERKDEIGLSTGLFVTSAGGGILFIEVAIMPGKGVLTLTGHLGDVMQESARAAMSYVRSRWKELGLDEKLFQKIDVHVHVPEGGTPKDGPSAGTAITTALASALTKIPVKKFIGMTGEVTLRGRVLEIGGVKEKVIGAHLAGLKTILMPKENKKDLEDIPKYVLKDLEFKFVSDMDEVLSIALIKPIKKYSVKQKSLPKSRPHLFAELPN